MQERQLSLLFVMYLSPLSYEVYLLVNIFSMLYVTLILQLIPFIFDRDEEKDQQACCVQEGQLTFFVMYLSPWMPDVYLLVNLFSKLYVTFIL